MTALPTSTIWFAPRPPLGSRAVVCQLWTLAVGQRLDGHDLSPELWSDGDIDPSEITDELLSAFDDMEPWGRGFEPPVFESEFTVLCVRAVGEDKTHLSLSLKGGGRPFGGIWFRALASGDEELPIPGERLRLLYTPAWNWWSGEEGADGGGRDANGCAGLGMSAAIGNRSCPKSDLI